MSSAKIFRSGRALWFHAGTSIQSLHLVRVLFDWVCASRPALKHNILSWASPTVPGFRENLKYVDFQRVIKLAAEGQGFVPDRFGAHGLRVGGASLLRAAGATDGEIMLMGRWRSLPACLGYQEVSTATHDRMLDMLLKGSYTNRDVRLQYRLPVVHTGSEPAALAAHSDSEADP
jgi:hypothetical protein